MHEKISSNSLPFKFVGDEWYANLCIFHIFYLLDEDLLCYLWVERVAWVTACRPYSVRTEHTVILFP